MQVDTQDHHMDRDRITSVGGLLLEQLPLVHGSWAICRPGQKAYDPPGRLRRYDLMIFDETSQLDDTVYDALFEGLKDSFCNPVKGTCNRIARAWQSPWPQPMVVIARLIKPHTHFMPLHHRWSLRAARHHENPFIHIFEM